jgi:hypothetical protein
MAPALAPEAETRIVIDATAPGRPLPHFWERMFGSGRAVLSLRERPWAAKALEGATARGPTPVERSGQKDSAYVVTFQGGSSVWMRAMRKQDRSRSS